MRVFIVFVLVVALLGVGIMNLRSTHTTGGDAQSQTQTVSSAQRQDCVSEDMHGTLTATVNSKGQATGWTCTFVAGYFACTAGADGAWTNCTFDSGLHPWPDNVSADALAHPDLYASGSAAR